MNVQSSPRRAARASARLAAVFVLAGAGVLGGGTAGAQQPVSGTIAGRVTSAQDGSPVADAAIFVPGQRRGAMSDGAGRYLIAGIAAGEHRVVAQRVGMAPDTVMVAVAGGDTVVADFRLRDAASVMAPVIVSATRELQRRREGSVTIDALAGAEVRQTRASHPSGIMNRLAGVHVAELSGEGHSMSMRQPITTKPMYLYLEDGVPTRPTGFFNHNALYEVNIPQSGGIEVIKGPATSLYGSDAIGGVVNVLTRPAPVSAQLETSVEGGAYGYRRVLASGGFSHAGHGVRVDVNSTHSDNWKDAAPFDRLSGTVRWDATLGASGWTAKTTLTASSIDQQDVPAISRALFDSARTVNLAPIAYRRARAMRFASTFDRDAGKSRFTLTSFARLNRMELLPSWQLTYDPQTWDTRNTSIGVIAKYRRDFAPLATRVIVGADVDVSPGSFVARQAVVERTAPWTSYTDGAVHYDYDATFRQIAPYVHAELSPLPGLRIDAGLRSDVAGYRYDTHLAPLDTGAHRRPASTTVSYSHLSPKVGVAYDASPALGLFASYRHGFRAPSQNQLFQQNSAANTIGLNPVKVDSYEVGMRGEIGQRVVYQLSAYDMLIRDDIVTYQTPQNTREATNAGRTRHRGIEASTGVALAPTVRLDASWSVTSQRYVEWHPSSTVSYGGHAMEQAPRDLGSVFVAWSPALLGGGRLAAEWSHTGAYATDPANTRTYAGHELLNLHASANVGQRAEVFGRMMNVANGRYAELVSYDRFTGELYTPGAPRSVFAGLRYAF